MEVFENWTNWLSTTNLNDLNETEEIKIKSDFSKLDLYVASHPIHDLLLTPRKSADPSTQRMAAPTETNVIGLINKNRVPTYAMI